MSTRRRAPATSVLPQALKNSLPPPNVAAPKLSTGTLSPELPSLRCSMPCGPGASVVGPVPVRAEVVARGLFGVALLVALRAVAEERVEQQDRKARADAHRPAVPADRIVHDREDQEAGDHEHDGQSVAQ